MFRSIAKNLIPDNFKDEKVINDVIDVFVDYIYENSELVLDVNNLYNEKNEVLYEELVKIYAANFYKTITDGSKNHKLAESIRRFHEKWGVHFDESRLNIRAIDLLSKNQLELFKSFQQSKGTLKSVEFIYRIIEQLNIESFVLETSGDLVIKKGNNVFEYIVEGSMLPEIFEAFVKPLAHPVGWTYLFLRTYTLYFTDYFLSEEVFDVKIFRIECQNSDCSDDFKNNNGYLFETDENNQELYAYEGTHKKLRKYQVPSDKPLVNITRFGINYPELNLPSELCLVKDNTIYTIEKTEIKGNQRLRVYFKSGEILEQNSEPRNLILYYAKGPNDVNQEIKKDYTKFLDDCALHLVYERNVVTRLKDKALFEFEMGLASSVGKVAAVGCGNLHVGNQYKVGERYINKDIPVTYRTRIRDEILKFSDYKALYRTGTNKIRPVFSKIEYDFFSHIRTEKVTLYKKTSDGLYYFEAPENSVFLDCLNLTDTKINVNVELINNSFIVKSNVKELKLIYWNDILNRVLKKSINRNDFVNENGKTYYESDLPVLAVYNNNIKVSTNIVISQDKTKYFVYIDELNENDNYTILCINETILNLENRQLKSTLIKLNAENNFTTDLNLNDCFVIGFFNNLNVTRVNFRYINNDLTNDFDKIVVNIEPNFNIENLKDNIFVPDFNNINEIIMIPAFTNVANFADISDLTQDLRDSIIPPNSEVILEVYYIENIKENKTVVYLENSNIELEEDLPISIHLDCHCDDVLEKKILFENDLHLEQNILKLYFDKDIRDKEVSLTCYDKNQKVIEELTFILNSLPLKDSGLKTNLINSDDLLYRLEINTQLQDDYTLWASEVYSKERNLNHNYVGYFAVNDIAYSSQFLRFDNSIIKKLKRTYSSNNGLICRDEFELETQIGKNGSEVIFELNDNFFKIKENFNIQEIGFYQSKNGWKNLYVDKYKELKFLTNFTDFEIIKDSVESSDIIDTLDDYYVFEASGYEHNTIKTPMPKPYGVFGLAQTNDFWVPDLNNSSDYNYNIKYLVIGVKDEVDFESDDLNEIKTSRNNFQDILHLINNANIKDLDSNYIQSNELFIKSFIKNGQMATPIELNKISDVYVKHLKDKFQKWYGEIISDSETGGTRQSSMYNNTFVFFEYPKFD